MSKFTTLKQVEDELQKGYALARLRTGDDQSLDRMRVLLKAVGNPHEKLKVVHIAGTSGKTSTSYYIAALLKSGGASKVGLTVSPHVRSFAERLQINGNPMKDQEIASCFSDFIDELGPVAAQGTYFELLICFVYWVFEQVKVDYAVMETGLGGLHDCTNMANRADKVCVITDIGYDHTEILGGTIEEISAQKAGIIHDKNTVFMIAQSTVVNSVITERVLEKSAVAHTIKKEEVAAKLGNLTESVPAFQKRNWILAREVYDFIATRDGLKQSPNIFPDDVIVPGRMEIRTQKDGTILVLDSAHNAQKVATFASSFAELFPGKKATVLLALKSDKDYQSVTKELTLITENLIVTQFQVAQDVPIKSLSADVIAQSAERYMHSVRVEPDLPSAFNLLINSGSEIKLVIGSIYLLGQLYETGVIRNE